MQPKKQSHLPLFYYLLRLLIPSKKETGTMSITLSFQKLKVSPFGFKGYFFFKNKFSLF